MKNKILKSRNFAFNAYEGWSWAIVKNRKVVLRNYSRWKSTKGIRSRDTLNPSDVRRMIGWLGAYLNWSDPDSTTEAIARTRVDCKSINRQMDIVAKELGIK